MINGDTLILLTPNQLTAANYLFVDREMCWELNDSLNSHLNLAQDLINNQENLISLLNNYDSLMSDINYQLQKDNQNLTIKNKKLKISTLSVSGLSLVLFSLLIWM